MRAIGRSNDWPRITARGPGLVPLVKILGGLALILFAVGLFFSVVPISANGDFIAAGC